MYRDESNILYLLFLDTVLKEVTDLNIAFQKANADITKLYTDLRILLLSVARRIFKPIYLKSIPPKTASTAMIHQADIAADIAAQRAISKANCDFDNSLLPLDSVDFGYKFTMYLTKSTISSENLQTVKVRSRSYMLKLCEELVKRFPDNISVLTNIRYFTLRLCMDQTSNVSVECLPWDLAAQDAGRDAIERQWRNLRTMRISEICDNVDENISTIDFWIAVNKIENSNGSKRFKDLAAFALRALSLPTSNADVERVFSVMALIKTKCRNRMLIDMLVSLMRIRIHMRVFKLCCKNYMPTDDMVKRFTSQLYESQKVTKKLDEDDNNDNMASDNLITTMNLLEYSEDNDDKDDIDDIYD
ncbi:GSCOCG00012538001-RA-CDS [Cotesia congregata]|nr:GSCOCG00012538001-RA-CDS [Cotesia congregata]